MRLSVFLTEDDRLGRRSVADEIVDRARFAGLAGVTVWRAVEGFGRGGHLRALRHPDLARGAPLLVELIDAEDVLATFFPTIRDLAPGALVTTEPVEIVHPRLATRAAGE